MSNTSEPHFALVAWADGSTTTATRDSRAEADAWLREEIECGGGDPSATALIPESQRTGTA